MLGKQLFDTKMIANTKKMGNISDTYKAHNYIMQFFDPSMLLAQLAWETHAAPVFVV